MAGEQVHEQASKTKALMEAAEDGVEGLPIGAMGIDETGRLFRKNDDGIYNFTFAYMGYQFAVRAEAKPGRTRMRVHAFLGHLPYTAESRYLRANVRAVVESAGAALGGRIQINGQQRILLIDEFNFDQTLTPASLLTKTVTFLLQAKPYLDLLRFLGGANEAALALLPAPQNAPKGA